MYFWSKLPQLIPTHFGINGEADAWSGKVIVAIQLPLMMAIIQMIINITVDLQGKQLNSRKVLSALIRLCFPVVTNIIQISVLLLALVKSINMAVIGFAILIAVLIVFGAFIFVLLKSESHKDDESTDEEGYKGLFYYNPDDSRAWVPKRFGFGWTINCASKSGRLYAILLIAIILLTVILAFVSQ
jgi:uncharacterized membrane protein